MRRKIKAIYRCTKVAVLALALTIAGSLALADAAPATIVIGSKNFPESYILSELIAQTLGTAGIEVERRFGLGGTLIVYEALRTGEIDIYVEYTGTISQAILHSPNSLTIAALNELLVDKGLSMLAPLGFNNSYVLAMRKAPANRLGLNSISDLRSVPDLNIALSHEFLRRSDGWEALRAAYKLPQRPVGLEHGLAYQALASSQIDLTDAYSTDGELERYDLHLLHDDAGFFPEYRAVPLVRLEHASHLATVLKPLAGLINERTMQTMNARVVIDKLSFADAVAEQNFSYTQSDTSEAASEPSTSRAKPKSVDMSVIDLIAFIWPLLQRHLALSSFALLLAALFGIPLAIFIHARPAVCNVTLYLAGLMQTIPSIALLALMIPLFGIGIVPAIIALFIYSLLPILRNTVLGLTTVDANLLHVAQGMGMTGTQIVRKVTLPLALPAIVTGLRTAAVISIGTATLAAFIGAGGLGEPVVTGLALNDTTLILTGAIPAAMLAVVTELGFELLELWLIPRHLRRTT